MEDLLFVAVKVMSVWLTVGFTLIVLPSVFGASLGISEVYMRILVKTLEWATRRIQKGVRQEQAMALKNSSSSGIIQRDETTMEKEIAGLHRVDFELSDVFYFSKKGIEAIVEDEVTQRFSSEELVSWNLLTRTNVNFQYISLRLTVVWVLGVLIRYCLLLPLRVTLAAIGIVSMIVGTTLVGQLPNSSAKDWLSELVHLTCSRILVRALSGTITYHNKLREHIADKNKLPILIFPEGTCINNTSVMMFKKGSFEIGGTIYPVAIKYDPQFGDAFWNSSKYDIVSYLLRIMTSWAIVCNVWYMPPMVREEGEDAVQFANRVKSAIAHQGGLTELSWDGGLKRAKVKDTFKEQQQKNYSKMIVGNGSTGNPSMGAESD